MSTQVSQQVDRVETIPHGGSGLDPNPRGTRASVCAQFCAMLYSRVAIYGLIVCLANVVDAAAVIPSKHVAPRSHVLAANVTKTEDNRCPSLCNEAKLPGENDCGWGDAKHSCDELSTCKELPGCMYCKDDKCRFKLKIGEIAGNDNDCMSNIRRNTDICARYEGTRCRVWKKECA